MVDGFCRRNRFFSIAMLDCWRVEYTIIPTLCEMIFDNWYDCSYSQPWFETFRGYPCSKFKCQLGRTMKRHLGNKKTLYTWMGLYWHVDETCRDVTGPYESVWNKKCRWVVPCNCVSTLQNHWKSKGPVMTGREQAELSKKSDNPHQTTKISSWPTWTPLALHHALMVYS